MNLEAYLSEASVRRKVYLHGSLGETFGKEFDLAVRSPAEALRLLEANFPRKFSDAIKKGSWQIVVAGAKMGLQCSLDMIHFCFPTGSIHFIPVPEGSGAGNAGSGGRSKGIILAIVGVALIATAFVGAAFAGGTLSAGLGSTAFAGITWGQIGLLGAAVLLLGVAILLTPTPKPDKEKPQTYGSFFYSGAVNSEREGGPVPICYGRVMAGSVVIHGGIFDDKFPVLQNPFVPSTYQQGAESSAPIQEGALGRPINDNTDVIYIGLWERQDPAPPVGGIEYK